MWKLQTKSMTSLGNKANCSCRKLGHRECENVSLLMSYIEFLGTIASQMLEKGTVFQTSVESLSVRDEVDHQPTVWKKKCFMSR